MFSGARIYYEAGCGGAALEEGRDGCQCGTAWQAVRTVSETAKSGSRLLRQWKAMHENAMVEAEQDDGPRPPEGVRAE